ncbi:MAG TPA: methionine biosynthesis protein MetW, partial [Methylophilaceae bacterium]|nr:methionine biosynthesis protein MetW [Methylophilaceae bacterium]
MNIPTSTNVNNTNLRKDFALITKWIQPETKVLDLGCGDGGLLTHLHNTL